MDLKRWKTKRWELQDEDGGDPAVIRHRPMTQAWKLRLMEQTRAMMARRESEPKDADRVPGWKADLKERNETWRDLMLDLVVSIDGLTMGGEPLSLEQAIDALIELEAPADAFVSYLFGMSEVTPEQGKS